MILKGYLFSILYALICLILSFALYKLGLPKKYTRKVVHILVGFEWVILYHYMKSGPHFLSVCLIFLALLVIAYKGKLMPMISSDGDNAPGTVYYALAMSGVAAVGCFIPEIMLPFGIGVMCTSIGDGFAGVAGQIFTKHNPKIYADKTFFGATTNFVASTLSALVISGVYSLRISVIECIAIGVLSVGLELITPYGLDNISITWAVTAVAYSYMYFESFGSYILPVIATPFIIAVSLAKKALTRSGILAALVLDLAISIAFKNTGFLVLCTFFLGSIIIDKIKNGIKKQSRTEENDDRGCRNYVQVVANGLVAFLVSIAYIATKNPIWIIPFVASLAEAFSDTVASGIGVFASFTFDPFRWRKCEKGISGGMSFKGTFASLVASLVLSSVAYFLNLEGFGIRELFIVAGCAFVGALFDSFLGSLLQVKYRCAVCGSVTERELHCGTPTVKHSGVSGIDNNAVNMLSSAFASILATFILIFM